MARSAVVVLLALLAAASIAQAEQWGAIVPGESTMQTVRAQYGGPTRTSTPKIDSYTTQRWVYEGTQAPAGVQRLTIDFGLVRPSGFSPDVVRSFVLEPRPGAFDREMIIAGWGPPHGLGREGESEYFFYKEGLFVYFDTDGRRVSSMVFTPPQLPPPQKPEPRR